VKWTPQVMGSAIVASVVLLSAVLRRQPVRRVAIVGGTHGNELLGVQLVGMLQQRLEETQRPSFESTCVLANPEAIRQNRRYVSVDLNRCFSVEALREEPGDSVEGRRAQELNALLGPKASEAKAPHCDMCLDVHTTTSKMGTCLMMAREDDIAVELAAHLQRRLPSIRIVFWAKGRTGTPTLPTVARSGMTVEVGGLPQGVCTAATFHETRLLLKLALDWLHARNVAAAVGTLRLSPVVVTAFERVGEVAYPRDASGAVSALVHPSLDARDFRPMWSSSPAFSRLEDGCSLGCPDPISTETGLPDPLLWRLAPRRAWWSWRRPPLFAFFVNEAAYVEKDVAFVLARKIRHTVQ